MTVGSFLATATRQLEATGIATGRLDCLVLLEDTLNTNRAQLLASPDLLIPANALRMLRKAVTRRAHHEPLAYIRNRTEFYGREFYVDNRVLEPRPESETMIDLLKDTLRPKMVQRIIDVGTGSGALGITAQLELPQAEVYGLDIDTRCLVVARRNSKRLQTDVHFSHSDLLEHVPDKLLDTAVLLCNLPYVPDNFQINTAATHEPRSAIFGGGDGLDLYRKLFAQLKIRNAKPAYVLTESLPPQHDMLKPIAGNAGFLLKQSADFIQVFRTDTGSSE